MKRLLVLAAAMAAVLAIVTPARADVCVAWGMDNATPPMPVCVEWAPATPAGWTGIANDYVPANGEVKICSKPGGFGGACAKRAIAAGQNVVLSNLGEFEGCGAHGCYRIRAYWFKLSRDSTTYTQENLSCPTCTTVPAAPNGLHNGDITYTIKSIVARN